jgi:ATP-dependent RNA helicase SUPV3L1/SUV3
MYSYVDKLIVDYLGEELEIVRLERMVGFEVMKSCPPNLTLVEPNTAIIAFSRRGVLAIKKQLEDAGRKVSVLYGNLSPGVRREEARRFRAGETDILVATDCIGMGLNLPIKTVIFSETTKFDGREERELNAQEIKQIGGRAGRFGKFDCGYIGATTKRSLNLVRERMSFVANESAAPCFVRPTLLQLKVLSEKLGTENIHTAIELFANLGNRGEQLVCSTLKEMLAIAAKIEYSQTLAAMSFRDKHLFTCAPVSVGETMDHYLNWLKSYCKKSYIDLHESHYLNYINGGSAKDDDSLNRAENCVKILTVYHWLARKKSVEFPDLEKCEDYRDKINTYIEQSLKSKTPPRKCRCGAKLAMSYKHKQCQACYENSYEYDFR